MPLRRRPEGEPQPVWWWVGCHGGAGVSTLQACAPGSAGVTGEWPLSPGPGPTRVVLVCRSHHSGLAFAQTALRQWASGTVPGVQVAGLVIGADAPGRLPKPLLNLMRLVTGAAPRLWSVPWVEAWRLGEQPNAVNTPKSVQKFIAELSHSMSRIPENQP